MSFYKTLKTESYKKGIIISSGYNLLGKSVTFLTTILITSFFGTQAKTDVFYYCFGTILLLSAFITSLNASVIIPHSMYLAATKSKDESMHFINFIMYLYAMIGITVSAALLTRPVDLFLFISKFDENTLSSNTEILVSSIPLFTLVIMATYLIDVITSLKFFTVPMITNLINSIFTFVFIAIFHDSLDIVSILIGLTLAYALQISMLIYFMATKLNWKFTLKIIHIDTTIFKNILFAQAGNLTSVLSSFIPLFLLSAFSAGIISSLNIAQRVADVPNMFILTQIYAVIAIKFNELYSEEKFVDLNTVFVSTAKFLIFILIPVSVVMFVFSHEITIILFKRGAFNEEGVMNTAAFLEYFSFLLPLNAVNSLVSRLFMAGRKILQGFFYQVIFNIILIFVIMAGVQSLGFVGYPLGLLCLNILNILACHFLIKFFFPMIEYKNILMYMGKVFALNVSIGLPFYFIKNIIDSSHMVIFLTAGCFLYFVLISIFNAYFHLNQEIQYGFVRLKAYLQTNGFTGSVKQ